MNVTKSKNLNFPRLLQLPSIRLQLQSAAFSQSPSWTVTDVKALYYSPLHLSSPAGHQLPSLKVIP
jgi:hypothetical protein